MYHVIDYYTPGITFTGLTMLIPYILTTRAVWASCKLRVFCLASKQVSKVFFISLRSILYFNVTPGGLTDERVDRDIVSAVFSFRKIN